MALVNVGDWVFYIGDEYEYLTGALGYIEEIHGTTGFVMFTKSPSGKPISIKRYVYMFELSPADDRTLMTEQEYKSLIDIALSTRDYGWCKELLEQYKKIKQKARV